MSLLMLPKIFRPKCRNYILHMDYILHNQITYGICNEEDDPFVALRWREAVQDAKR